MPKNRLPEIISRYENDLLSEWVRLQKEALVGRNLPDAQLTADSRALLASIREATLNGAVPDARGPEWAQARSVLGELSRARAIAGFNPRETATFVFSLKQPLFSHINRELEHDAKELADTTWIATTMLDSLGLYTTEVYQNSREEIISRQQFELLELSTPVVELWTGILALPLIGTLDSSRTQIVMQNLLEAIVSKSASIAIIDITGVPTVDTLVAQHLLKTVAAARLMGAECMISGIRPQIAQTIIHLGVDLGNVITKATLADAFQVALKRAGLTVARV
jgi:rsbT co-antagonist protein RsbR